MTEDALIGRELPGRIEIKRKIGEGGMGAVYEGYQEHLQRRIAVKVMTKEHATNPVAAEYFLREARSASTLRHPNIIQIIDFGQDGDLTYMAMEFIPGDPLSTVMENEFPMEPHRVAHILDQALSALSVAHERQIVHRDLKPDNLMVEQVNRADFVKVLDFGIAQSKAPNRTQGPLTQQGAVVGTPQYMAPEQAMGERVDGRSDLFSLGVILYEILTQEVPFRGKSLPEVLIKVIKHHPPPPSALRSDLVIDPTLEACCLRALKKDPSLRYENANQFRDALAPLLGRETLQPTRKAAPGTFIFKKKDGATPTLDAESETPATMIGAPDVDVTGKTPAPWAIEQGLGLDISELREDLVGERRHVVVLVAHQRTHGRLSAEELSGAIDAFQSVFKSVAKKWNGTLQGRQGSFYTLIFGFPTPRTDDAFRAIQAGLQLRVALRKAAPESVKFAFSVAEGEVFCPQGDVVRAAGFPIDDASETVRSAGDGDLRIAGESFQSSLESMFRLSAPVQDGSRGVLGILNAASEPESDEVTSLVGRDEEIAVTLGLLGRVVRGEGNLMVIDGQPGIGKSALIREAKNLARQRDVTILQARFRLDDELGVRDVIRQLLLDLLRQKATSGLDAQASFMRVGVPAEYARVLAAVAEDDLRAALGFQGRPGAASTEVNGSKIVDVAFRVLLSTLSQNRSIAVFVDDAKEYNEVFENLLYSWSRFAREFPAMFVLGLRTATNFSFPRFPENGTIVHLDTIREAPARALLRSELRSDTSPELLSKFIRLAGGVPLNLVQLISFAKLKRTFTIEEAEEWLAKVDDVRSIFEQQLFEQQTPVRNVLALLSALGTEAHTNLIADMASSAWEPRKSLQSAYEQGILEVIDYEADDPIVRFASPAFREVVYQQLSSKARQKIHSKVAGFYDERVRASGSAPLSEDIASLVRHLCATDRYQEGFHHLSVLVNRAFSSCDYELALQHIDNAIRLIEDNQAGSTEDAVSLRLRRVRALEATGNLKAALDEIRGLERAGEIRDVTKYEIRLELARLWLIEEDADLVERVIKKAVQEVRVWDQQNPSEESALLLIRGLQLMTEVLEKQGRLPHAAQAALDAIDLAERRKIDPERNAFGPIVIWGPLNQLGRIRLRLGEYDSAAKMFELALRVTDKTDDLRGDMLIRGNIAALLQAQDRLDSAYRTLQRSLKTAKEISDLRSVSKLEHNRGLLLIRQRRMEMARQAFDASLIVAEEMDWREGIALNTTRIQQHFSKNHFDEPPEIS